MASIHWHEWDDAAFARARAEDKCIVLFLAAFWNPVARRMERDTWSDPEVARLMESDYVGMRVDADRRPDVHERYAPGTLPTTAFLDPSGALLYAAGALESQDLKPLLIQLKSSYVAHRESLAEAIRERDAKVEQVMKGRYVFRGGIGASAFEKTLRGILATYDSIHAGFGSGAKMPLAPSLRVLLLAECERANPDIRRALERTLDAMMNRGMADAVEGGFFNGCAQRHWSQPNFEKLPEVNAELLGVYLDAGLVLEAPRFLEAARRTASWIVSVLFDPERGAFRGSQAADEAYYLQPIEERAKRPRPPVDVTVFTDRSAKVASALARASTVLADPALLDVARQGLHYVLNEHRDPERGLAHASGGGYGLLRDRVALGSALLDLAEHTGDLRYLAEGERQGDRLVARYWDAEERGLLDRCPGEEELGELSRRRSHPSETAQAAMFLLRLAAHTGEKRYRTDAVRLLRALPDFAPDWGHFTAEVALVADFAERGPTFVARERQAAYVPRKVTLLSQNPL
ncbi:MAG: thioredoxin domain-containing protein [Planctomycetes bacterium]|nr:thioredoxin domain-containing protein [Planctomycetota bacterium]